MCEADEFRDFRWRTHERDVFRELNKSPFIAYPIKETVNTTAHKASLLVQAALGCADMSNVPEGVRRQINMDTGLLFERMHRLVRAVVECKASDLDGVTCRVALDLARSMTARTWEGKPMQLTQVPHIGPVFMRKFVASGITTVHGLVETGASNIERILSRFPPFGKKMADELAHFPRLTLEARIAIETPRTFNPGKQPVARIDAIIGFSNTVGKPKWRGKIPSVTFMAETTKGVLAHWWRGSLKKFKEEDEHKFSLPFEVELSDVTEKIICHFACEDIVGTIVTKTLEHGLPVSAFPSKESTPQLSRTSGKSATFMMDDDIRDDDLLEITTEKRRSQSEACLVIPEDSDGESQQPVMNRDRKNHIDDQAQEPKATFLSSQDSEKENTPWQPIQLPNGKFKCNHTCADAGLKNGNGKACAHRCCREGLDVPRKPKRLSSKRKTGMDEIVVADPISISSSESMNKKAKTTIAKGKTSMKSPAREPLASATATRRDHHMMELDAFELDGDGLFDLTQVEHAHVDNLWNPHRSPLGDKRPTSKGVFHDADINFFEDLSDGEFQLDFTSPHRSRDTAKGDGCDVRNRTNLLHAELLKTKSNSTDDFSGDSVFDGVTVDESDRQPRRSHNAQVGTAGISKKRRGDCGDVPLHEVREIESTSERSSLGSPPTTAECLEELNANQFEKGSRANVACPSPNHPSMARRAGTATAKSMRIHPTTCKASSQKGPVTEMETNDSEDETYIFSNNYVPPPPRDSLGEDSVILPHESNGGHALDNVDARAVPKSAELDSSSSKNDDLSKKPQQNSEWQGFEPGFTDEFRDLVEFI